MAAPKIIQSRIESLKNLVTILFGIGIILQSLAFVLIVPIFVALFYQERQAAFVFFVASVLTFLVGMLIKTYRRENPMDVSHLFFFVPIAYLSVAVISAIPIFFLEQLPFIDALFEAMSGITTTGLTMIPNVETSLKSVLIFRSLLQYCGGLGIIIFSLASTLHPSAGDTRRYYLAEGRREYLTPNIQKTIKKLWLIYLFYFGLGVVLLFFAGMGLFDAVNHSMTGIGTGGFSTKSESIFAFGNIGIERVMMFLMVLGADWLQVVVWYAGGFLVMKLGKGVKKNACGACPKHSSCC